MIEKGRKKLGTLLSLGGGKKRGGPIRRFMPSRSGESQEEGKIAYPLFLLLRTERKGRRKRL